MVLQVMKSPWYSSGKWREDTNSAPELGRERLGTNCSILGISMP